MTARDRVEAYLDEVDRVIAAQHVGPYQADEVHGLNDIVLSRSDIREVLDGQTIETPDDLDAAGLTECAVIIDAGDTAYQLVGDFHEVLRWYSAGGEWPRDIHDPLHGVEFPIRIIHPGKA